METANYLMGDLLTSICPAVNYYIATCLHFMEVRQPVSTLIDLRQVQYEACMHNNTCLQA